MDLSCSLLGSLVSQEALMSQEISSVSLYACVSAASSDGSTSGAERYRIAFKSQVVQHCRTSSACVTQHWQRLSHRGWLYTCRPVPCANSRAPA